MVTDDGTASAEFEDDRFTVVGNPGLERFTVQVPPVPGITLVGLHEIGSKFGFGSNVTVVVFVEEP